MVYISGGNQLIDARKIFDSLKFRPGLKVADLGCGVTGFFTIPTGKLVGETGTVYAVDILKSVLKEVATRARLEGVKNIKTVWTNLEIYGATKIPEHSLDAVLIINLLCQTKQRQEILREAHRLLKPSGKMLVCDWNNKQAPLGPREEDKISKNTVKKMADELNLRMEKEFPAGLYHYGLIFKKI
ncbi:methyltransferase domain-containing protein [Candidatus Parcubacteria bacterium]|nr:MAG: methyltransferase domain-containing protein [Candidatus Parcubacteria bacterium]